MHVIQDLAYIFSHYFKHEVFLFAFNLSFVIVRGFFMLLSFFFRLWFPMWATLPVSLMNSLIDFRPFLQFMLTKLFYSHSPMNLLSLPALCHLKIWFALFCISSLISFLDSFKYIQHMGCPEVKKNGQWYADTLGQNLSARYEKDRKLVWFLKDFLEALGGIC